MKKIMISIVIVLVSVVAANATYMPVGPQANVLVDDVINDGWSIVYSETMATPLGSDPANDIMGAYTDYSVMLAGRAVGSDTFTVLAQAQYEDVFFLTNNTFGVDTTHNANGSEWYYTPNFSWGFALGGEVVDLGQADTADTLDPLRMSLHTFDWTGGWRIGTNTGLNSNTNWEKVILVNDFQPVPEPSTWVLLGTGIAGLAYYRKKKS